MLSNAPCRRGTDRRRRRFHPTLLRLEDRTVLSPTIFVVTNTADSGPGSLRQAILYADANDSVPETISFNIPTTDPGFANGVFTIQPHSDLPILLDNITIDGTTQTKFTGDTNPLGPEVVLNGSLDSNGSGLRLDDNNTVEGLVIDGFSGDGVSLNWYTTNHTAMNNRVLNNYIGTDPTGTSAVPNTTGINLTGFGSPDQQAANNVFQGNLISGNLGSGIGGGDFTNTQILDNMIGTERDGVTPLGNGGSGVVFAGAGAPRNLVQGNIIACNGGDGILDAPDYNYSSIVDSPDGHQGNAFLQNSIFSNGMLGIDLRAPDATQGVPLQNTPGGPHQGANLLQNYPVLSSALSTTAGTVITGSLNSTPNETFHLEFFASPTANASGYGEGKTYLGATSVTTDASGNASFSVTVPEGNLAGQVLSSTATDPGNNTSEFSADIPVKATPTVTWANPADITYGTPLGTTQLDATASVSGSFVYGPALGTVLHAGSNQTLTVTFTPTDTTDYNNVRTTVQINVTPAPLTITANNQSKVYGAPLPALTAGYSGFVNGDTAASLTTQPTLSTTATASSHVTGNPYSISASGAVDPDYSISYVSGTLTVTPAPLTITANNATKVYGAVVPTLTYTVKGFVNGDTTKNLTKAPTLTTKATKSSGVGSYAIVISSGTDPNYTIKYVPGNLTVTTAPLTITADNKTKVVGSANPTLTYTVEGFANGDTSKSLTKPPTLTTTATMSSKAGSYPITVSGAVDPNYTIKYVNGKLTVLRP